MDRTRITWFIIAMCFLGIGLANAQTETTKGFLPVYKIGDSWVVEASYRDLKSLGEPWLPPIQWVFKVKSMKDIHRQPCYVIHVYPKKRDLKLQAIIYLSAIDLRAIRVIDIFPTVSGVKSREKPIDPFHQEPLLSEDSLVPYDLPVFPLVRKTVQQRDGLAAYQAPEPKSYEKLQDVGGLKFKKSVSQVAKTPDRQHIDSFAGYRTGGEIFQIELFDSQSRGTITQFWQEGSPWAISSESLSRKTRLILNGASNTAPINQSGGTQK